jgi:hypothetical protein
MEITPVLSGILIGAMLAAACIGYALHGPSPAYSGTYYDCSRDAVIKRI